MAVVVDGSPVVDLWAGWADGARHRPWQQDTLVDVFSVGKAMVTLCVLRLVDQGKLDLDAPVSGVWPEFGAGGKAEITVRTLLSHRAGLPAIRQVLPRGAMYDWQRMTAAIAEQEPWWEPGTAHGYHVNTFGFLAGEIVRRVSDQRVGVFFDREIACPLGAEFRFGVAEQDVARTADFIFTEETTRFAEETTRPSDVDRTLLERAEDERRRLMAQRAYLNPPDITGIEGAVNTAAWRRAEMPSTNGHATARGIARIYGALAAGGTLDGTRVLLSETIKEATVEASDGTDLVLGRRSRFGLGFQLTQPERPLGPNQGSFGHFGAGGSVGFADPDAGVAFAYTMNRGGPRWRNPRNRALIDALYEGFDNSA